MSSISTQMPYEILRIIFNYTPTYIFRNDKLIQINKIKQEKYKPLRKMFSYKNKKCNVINAIGMNHKSVNLYTKQGRNFYNLSNFGTIFNTYSIHKINQNNNESIIVYVRQ